MLDINSFFGGFFDIIFSMSLNDIIDILIAVSYTHLWLIGRRCKCSNVFSLSILIGRGLDQDK